MLFRIPCAPAGQSNWRQRTQLSGRDYIFVFDWNQRDGHWWIQILDQDSVAIASGIKLVTNWPLLRGVVDARRPPGELFVVDTTDAAEDPGFSDLGTRFELRYYDVDELVLMGLRS